MGFSGFARQWKNYKKKVNGSNGGQMVNEWSDYRCKSCHSRVNEDGEKLHVVAKEPSRGVFFVFLSISGGNA